MRTIFALFGVILTANIGCSQGETKSDAWRRAEQSVARQEWEYTNGMAWPADVKSPEIVMSQGMEITARTENGEVKIRAGSGLERFYTWDGETRSVELWPRKNRWYGSLGIYYPGPGEHWKANNGITRGVLSEGVLWFKTTGDFTAWMKRSTSDKYVFSDEGFVIGFTKVPARKQINVEVWQVMIGGKKPQSLPGSKNDSIAISKKEDVKGP
jgi:hypothetical protein